MKIKNVNKMIKFFDEINKMLGKKDIVKQSFHRWFLSWTPLSTKNENVSVKVGCFGPYSTSEWQIIKTTCKDVLNFEAFNKMLNDSEAEITCYIGLGSKGNEKFCKIENAKDFKIVEKYKNKKFKIKTLRDFHEQLDILDLYFTTITEY